MMAVVPAVSVCPTCAVPVIVGAPVAGVLTLEPLVTAGTPSVRRSGVKEAASLPAVSWMAFASLPRGGVGVGDE